MVEDTAPPIRHVSRDEYLRRTLNLLFSDSDVVTRGPQTPGKDEDIAFVECLAFGDVDDEATVPMTECQTCGFEIPLTTMPSHPPASDTVEIDGVLVPTHPLCAGCWEQELRTCDCCGSDYHYSHDWYECGTGTDMTTETVTENQVRAIVESTDGRWICRQCGERHEKVEKLSEREDTRGHPFPTEMAKTR